MAQGRMIVKKTPILSELVKLRFKADGGAVFVSDNGVQEDTFYLLGQKIRMAIDEMKRKTSSDVVYKGFEVEFIADSFPITLQAVVADEEGGAIDTNYIITNEPSNLWQEVEEYIKTGVLIELWLGDGKIWESLLGTSQKEFDIEARGLVGDEVKLSIINDRLGDTFIYDSFFAKLAQNSAEMGTGLKVYEKLLQNMQDGAVADLDIYFKLNFFGGEDKQILN